MKPLLRVLLATLALPLFAARPDPAPATLLNVSYDVTRPFYRAYNAAFAKDWQTKTGQEVTVTMSHGGSSVQARAVLDGLDADVVTMNQDTDIDLLAEHSDLVAKEWRARFPNNSVPYTSTILFVVRGGNPKGIKDWDDLVRPGVKIIVPNPKTSGNGRYSYLAAWAFALRKSGGDAGQARDFVKALFAHAEVLDSGGRGSTTTFVERGIGDVLLTFENEALALRAAAPAGDDGKRPEVVVPSLSIRADPPIAIVDKNVEAHGTRALAEAYLRALYLPATQELAARYFFRPFDKDVLARHADVFRPVDTIDVDTAFGGWAKAQETHFRDGGIFDQISRP